MDKRKIILVTAFCGFVVYLLAAQWIYPTWIAPLLTLDQRLAARRKDRDKLEETEERVELAKRQYRALVARVGSFNSGKVETQFRERLNNLIEKHHLLDANVSPTRSPADRKTGVEKLRLTVTVVGSLKSAVEFLKDLAELPHLVRVGNAALYPVSGGRRGSRLGRVNLRVPLEIWVLPKKRIVGVIDEETLVQPTTVVRHRGDDYSMLWEAEPFTEPQLLEAKAGRDISVRQDRPASLAGKATGGVPPYESEWSPATALKTPAKLASQIDTSTPFSARTYTLSVTDAKGRTVTDTVKVTVLEPRLSKNPRRSTVAKARPSEKRWPDRRQKQLTMALMSTTKGSRVSEVMVSHTRSKEKEYYLVGAEFDGGKLVYVHPTGALVQRGDDYYVYPIGAKLDQDISVGLEKAGAFPELVTAADHIRRAAEAAKRASQEPVSKSQVDSPAAPAKAGHETPTADKKTPPAAATKSGAAAARRPTPGSRALPDTVRRKLQERQRRRRGEKPNVTPPPASSKPGEKAPKNKTQEKAP